MARRAFRFPTWDKFILPLPFTSAVLAVGEPCIVPKRLDANGLEEWQERMRIELEALYAAAREALISRGCDPASVLPAQHR